MSTRLRASLLISSSSNSLPRACYDRVTKQTVTLLLVHVQHNEFSSLDQPEVDGQMNSCTSKLHKEYNGVIYRIFSSTNFHNFS